MILDTIQNAKRHLDGPIWAAAFDFIETVTVDTAEGKYEITDTGVYAGVDEYQTKPLSDCRLEGHRCYIDIQVLVAGREYVGWSPINEQSVVSVPYDSERDLIFFESDAGRITRLALTPGLFAVFYPEDGHMPQMAWKEIPEPVKKVVVKIPLDLVS